MQESEALAPKDEKGTDEVPQLVPVRRLIEILQTMNPDAIACVEVSDSYYNANVRENLIYENTYDGVSYLIIHGD